MDAQNAIVQTLNEVAYILTGRSEIKTKEKKTGLGELLGKLNSLKLKK
jgi:pilus assembly protein CpaE